MKMLHLMVTCPEEGPSEGWFAEYPAGYFRFWHNMLLA